MSPQKEAEEAPAGGQGAGRRPNSRPPLLCSRGRVPQEQAGAAIYDALSSSLFMECCAVKVKGMQAADRQTTMYANRYL